MLKKSYAKQLLLDLFFLIILCSVSLFLMSFYFGANYLNTGYEDWMVHAFRVKVLDEYGFTSWIHTWSNGISVWKSYQFIPHFITLGVAKLLQLEIARAMVLLTIAQFVLLRIFIYVPLRLLKFSPLVAFICALLSFDIAQYWGGVGDWSLQFGFTVFPLVLFLWVKYWQGKVQYLYPYVAGVLFYVHPLLGFSSFALWFVASVFSDRRLLSVQTLVQLIIMLTASSLFWFPLVFRDSYSYSSTMFATKSFLTLVLASYKYYGLSLFLIGCFVASAIKVFMPMPKGFRWAKVLFIYILFYFILIVIATKIDLPRFLAQFQFTRGATLVGIALLFVFAPVVDAIRQIPSRAVRGVVLFLFAFSLIEGIWFSSIYSPPPVKNFEEAISQYMKKSGSSQIAQHHTWTSTIGLSSYFAINHLQSPYSYMGHLESNQVAPRIMALIHYQPFTDVPTANVERIKDYFKVTGTRYAFFDESSPFTAAFSKPNSGFTQVKRYDSETNIYHLFESKGEVRDAVLVNAIYAKKLAPFPTTLELTDAMDQISLDTHVKKFNEVIYSPGNLNLAVTYPTQESVQIEIPEDRNSRLVYLNESYDTGWKAYFDDKEQSIKPAGPNFMVITLDSLKSGGTLVLKHSWPIYFYILAFLIVLIPLEMVLYELLAAIFLRKKTFRKL